MITFLQLGVSINDLFIKCLFALTSCDPLNTRVLFFSCETTFKSPLMRGVCGLADGTGRDKHPKRMQLRGCNNKRFYLCIKS